MTPKQIIAHPDCDHASGRLASAIRCGPWIHLSGQGPLEIPSLQYAPGTIEEETRLTLLHIEKILKAAGASKTDVVKCTCYLADLSDFAAFHRTFCEFFGDPLPCRTTVQAVLLRNIRVEIDAVAFVSKES